MPSPPIPSAHDEVPTLPLVRRTARTVHNKRGIVTASYAGAFHDYRASEHTNPLLLLGNALAVLKELPPECIDFAMTSPPYWGKREYDNGGIGLEGDYREFVRHLTAIFAELQRVLKATGSFWLNIGDSYSGKGLVGVPWRVAFELTDTQGWILRNSVIWNKLKGGMDNSKDRLANVHEHVFHFVKQAKGYYYNADAIRAKPRAARVVNGAVISATGVSGIRYKRQIELSTALTDKEKKAAFAALDRILTDVGAGAISDFRMIIRGQQRATHSDREKVSGRAKELHDKGFYFLKYHPKGSNLTCGDYSRRHTAARSTLCTLSARFAPPLRPLCPPGGIASIHSVALALLSLPPAISVSNHRHRYSRRYLEISQERNSTLL